MVMQKAQIKPFVIANCNRRTKLQQIKKSLMVVIRDYLSGVCKSGNKKEVCEAVSVIEVSIPYPIDMYCGRNTVRYTKSTPISSKPILSTIVSQIDCSSRRYRITTIHVQQVCHPLSMTQANLGDFNLYSESFKYVEYILLRFNTNSPKYIINNTDNND